MNPDISKIPTALANLSWECVTERTEWEDGAVYLVAVPLSLEINNDDAYTYLITHVEAVEDEELGITDLCTIDNYENWAIDEVHWRIKLSDS
jgi:hypothetical protein